jgi:hypothetical protein
MAGRLRRGGMVRRTRLRTGKGRNAELKGIIWAENVPVDRVRICKMGALESKKEG